MSTTGNTSKPANYDWAKEIPCKNITIYGYCKHEDKCAFKHNINNESPLTTPVSKVAALAVFTPSLRLTATTPSAITVDATEKKKFNFDSPSFTPTAPAVPQQQQQTTPANKYSSPKVSNVPTFIPGGDGSTSQQPQQLLQQQILKFNIDTPSFSPSSYAPATPVTQQQAIPSLQQRQQQGPATSAPPSQQQQQQQQQQGPPQSLLNNDMYYHQQVAPVATSAYPLQYHLYSQLPPPHFQLPLAAYERDMNTLFIPNQLRETLQRKNEASNQILPHSNLPDHINNYHSLVPIDNSFDNPSKAFGLLTQLYKVQSTLDGKLYCLRRIELQNPIIEKSITVVKKWNKIHSANIIKPLELFTNMSFNDNSLFLVYDYFPCSSTLIQNHFQPIGTGGKKPTVITETLLWSYMIQLTNAVVEAHSKKLAIRSFDLSKIVVTNENRIRLSGCGVLDILEYDEFEDFADLQKQDLQKFSELMITISSTTMPPNSRAAELSRDDLITILPLSDDFKSVLKYLNSSDVELQILQEKLAPHLLKTINGLQNSLDFMESQLSRELENGRLFRLITKLNFIVERPNFLQDESWSETGERYPIKLFRDFVFHQYNDLGKPLLDLTHVLSCLNKLDAGIDEKLLLVSSDEKSCLIISYKELKDLIDSSFRELNNL